MQIDEVQTSVEDIRTQLLGTQLDSPKRSRPNDLLVLRNDDDSNTVVEASHEHPEQPVIFNIRCVRCLNGGSGVILGNFEYE